MGIQHRQPWRGLVVGHIRMPVLVDVFALSSPFLSRLPARRDYGWRPGHFPRAFPEGFRQSLNGENVLKSQDLKPLLDSVLLITRGPIFSAERIREIWRINTGFYKANVRRAYSHE